MSIMWPGDWLRQGHYSVYTAGEGKKDQKEHKRLAPWKSVLPCLQSCCHTTAKN